MKEQLDPKSILKDVLSTEDELRNFCSTNNLCASNSHLFTFAFLHRFSRPQLFFRLVIEAYLFLLRFTSHAPDTKIPPSRKRAYPSDKNNMRDGATGTCLPMVSQAKIISNPPITTTISFVQHPSPSQPKIAIPRNPRKVNSSCQILSPLNFINFSGLETSVTKLRIVTKFRG